LDNTRTLSEVPRCVRLFFKIFFIVVIVFYIHSIASVFLFTSHTYSGAYVSCFLKINEHKFN